MDETKPNHRPNHRPHMVKPEHIVAHYYDKKSEYPEHTFRDEANHWGYTTEYAVRRAIRAHEKKLKELKEPK